MNREQRRLQARKRRSELSEHEAQPTVVAVQPRADDAPDRSSISDAVASLVQIAREIGFLAFAGFAWALVKEDEFLLGIVLLCASSALLPDSPLLEKLERKLLLSIAVVFCVLSVGLAYAVKGDKAWSNLTHKRPFRIRVYNIMNKENQRDISSDGLLSNANYVYDLDIIIDASIDNETSSSLAVNALSVDIKCIDTGWQRLTRVPSVEGYDHLIHMGRDQRSGQEIGFTDLVNELAVGPVDAGRPTRGLILAEYPIGMKCSDGPVDLRFNIVDFTGHESVIYPEKDSINHDDSVILGTDFKVGQTYNIAGYPHLKYRNK